MEEEISLRELIEILLQGKWIIGGITVLALLASGFISYFVLEPTYEARATMLVVEPKIEVRGIDSSALSVYLESLSETLQLSLDTYKNQVKNPAILDRVRKKLDLDPQKYTIRSLSNMIKVTVPEKTNLMEIAVTNPDPRLAADLANTLAEEFVAFIDDQGKKRVDRSIPILEDQLATAQENLDQALDEYTRFLSETRGVDHLEKAYEVKVALLTNLQTNLVTARLELDAIKAGLVEGEKNLQNISPVIITEKSLGEDQLLRAYVEEKTKGDLSQLVGIKMQSEEVNQAYVALLEQVNMDKITAGQLQSRIAGLEEAISRTSGEVEALQIELAEKKAVEERLQNRLNNAKNNYDRIMAKYQDALAASSIEGAGAQINLVAPAWAPAAPVGPRKLFNLALAGILGAALGVLTALFRHYWISSGVPKPSA
ncbi:MAG: GumC family protein [Bacillota bacterium]|jgi:succinoglycan biosynthesis transport protein ExoP